MSFFSALLNGIWTIIAFILSVLWNWVALLFVVPFYNLQILWVIIPIWLGWFFAEFFQEKEGTSFGNAISNGAVAVWVGLDWMRYTINGIIESSKFGFGTFGKLFAACAVLTYGVLIIYWGIKANKLAHILGRIREATYVLLVLSPFVYGVTDISLTLAIAILLGAPAFYFIIEYIDRLLPDPKAVKVDIEEAKEVNPVGDIKKEIQEKKLEKEPPKIEPEKAPEEERQKQETSGEDQHQEEQNQEAENAEKPAEEEPEPSFEDLEKMLEEKRAFKEN